MSNPDSKWDGWIGEQVTIVFDLDPTNWPIEGFPAFATLLAVDMPLIRLGRRKGMRYNDPGPGFWFNAKYIKKMALWGISLNRTEEGEDE